MTDSMTYLQEEAPMFIFKSMNRYEGLVKFKHETRFVSFRFYFFIEFLFKDWLWYEFLPNVLSVLGWEEKKSNGVR